MVQAPITAIVTAYRRIAQTLVTLQKLVECSPAPAEILVHVDGNQTECAAAIRGAFPNVRVLLASDNLGPGGGRNKLIRSASCDIVASFDDDSYPLDEDYFGQAFDALEAFPDASVLSAAIYHRAQTIAPPSLEAQWVAHFGGGGCIYRREAFLATRGYLPLAVAYQIEEVDVALQLHASGHRILHTPWLRVFHDNDFAEHSEPHLVAGTLANMGLLVYLRYPPVLWPYGMLQVLNLVRYNIRHRRLAGLISGIARIPRHAWTHRRHRHTLPREVLRSFWALRRNPVPAGRIRLDDRGGVRTPEMSRSPGAGIS
jgi:GT2 family glycosyltransferase